MSIRLGSSEDRPRWDEYVESHSGATPYHLMGWCHAVSEAYGHEQYFLVSEDSGRINGVLPLVLMRSPLGGTSLCSLPYCDVCGCLVDSQNVERELMAFAVELASRSGAALHIRTRQSQTAIAEEDLVGKVSMLLDLPPTSTELAASLKSKLRSQIRKAEKNGLVFRSGNGTAELETFYRVFAENMRDLGSPVHAKSWFEAIRKHLESHFHLGVVLLEEKPVGAGIVLKAAGSAAIPWASTVARFNHLAPNMLLYWSFLRDMTDAGCTQFDFGRSSVGEGTYRFKKQWGARPAQLNWRDYESGGAFMEVDGRSGGARAFAATIWKFLPLPVANAIGPRIRKFISL
jgi:FemAB-related protein (PEP-CTERM system-associated)